MCELMILLQPFSILFYTNWIFYFLHFDALCSYLFSMQHIKQFESLNKCAVQIRLSMHVCTFISPKSLFQRDKPHLWFSRLSEVWLQLPPTAPSDWLQNSSKWPINGVLWICARGDEEAEGDTSAMENADVGHINTWVIGIFSTEAKPCSFLFFFSSPQA